LTVPDGPVRLRLGTAGSFDALSFERFVRPSPEPGQVEIAVRAAGLNFSDVLKAMGLYPGLTDAVVPLGIECSGVVTAVGSGVERFQVGDAVMGVAPYSFASHARTAEYALVPKPQGWSDEEAAGVPITFLTAHYSLCTLARLQAGERVLIHAGAGGVGLAAIQIAQHVGAEVFATAGSESKRAFLRSLGVKHVMDSRSTDFAEEIRQLTGREGVDVVLNSLPGEAIPKSLGLLRAYGRFLEIGKIDIYQNRMIGLLPFQDNLSYFAIDLDRMLRQRPAAIRQLFDEVVDRIAAGAYRPLPTTRFGMGDIRDAFRYMAQRKNIGKVVVSMLDRPVSAAADNRVGDVVVDDGSYLVTGGLGALGLVVARWLADRGARHLVLLGRQPPKPQAAEQIGALTRQGVRVAVVAGDVADRTSLGAALASIPASFPPLRGVVHAAGALADGLLFDMDIDRLDRALSPKMDGAWNLHEATLGLPLDFFVLFSSIAAPLGSPGQANYAAGNAFLDALAAYRMAGGLPALSIDWGPWAEGGMAAEGDRGAQLLARGLRPLPPQGALDVLERLLRTKAVNVAVVDADWAQMHAASSGRGLASLGDLWASTASEQPVRGKQVDRVFLDRLAGLEPTGKAAALAEYFSQELARIMGIDAADLELGRPLNAMGLDSLMAMELKNNLETRLGFSLPMATFFDGPSVNSLALVAAKLLTGEQSESSEGDLSSAWSPLVKLAEGAGRPPLFCIHPLGGDVRCYVELARQLGDSWPVYALRAYGVDDGQSPHVTMEELAADYASAIQRAQPEGPYYLAGWSAGGIYALEVALALRGRGERIGLLALFDTPLPSIYDGVDLEDNARFIYDLVNFTNRFAGAAMDVSYEALRQVNGDAAFEMALDEAKRHGVVPADARSEMIRRLCEVGRANVRLIMRRQLPSIDCEIVMFHPQTKGVLAEVSGQSLPDDLGWSGVSGQVFSITETPGDHFSMLTGNGAVELGQRLRERLEAARASDGQGQ
jgi:NADPH:quinone reductase-like Zn-dependent oxidoreductase/thioesterase domain-containing protein/acyl carrier protein